VTVTIAGETRAVTSACLRPRVTRNELDRYFEDYLNNDTNVEQLIRERVAALHTIPRLSGGCWTRHGRS
jgi:hypothetical protein